MSLDELMAICNFGLQKSVNNVIVEVKQEKEPEHISASRVYDKKDLESRPKNKFTIIPPKKKLKIDPRFKMINQYLPGYDLGPFVQYIMANVGKGKSVNILGQLYLEGGYTELFDKIYFVSPTIMNDQIGEAIMKDKKIEKVYENLDTDLAEWIGTVHKMCAEQVAKEKASKSHITQTLIIFDDCLGLKGMSSTEMVNLATKHRHCRISMIVTSQKFKMMPPGLRENASNILLFGTGNSDEIKKYYEEYGSSMDKKKFQEIFNNATKDGYNFLHVQRRKGLFTKGFSDEHYAV